MKTVSTAIVSLSAGVVGAALAIPTGGWSIPVVIGLGTIVNYTLTNDD